MTKQPFDIRIKQFHQSLSDDVRHSVGAFMQAHGAKTYYDEMVDHPNPDDDPDQREMDAVMCGLLVYRHVPESAWGDEFASIVGEEAYSAFLEAVQEALKKFNLRGIQH